MGVPLAKRRPAASRRRTFKELRTHRGLQRARFGPLSAGVAQVFAFHDRDLALGDCVRMAVLLSDPCVCFRPISDIRIPRRSRARATVIGFEREDDAEAFSREFVG